MQCEKIMQCIEALSPLTFAEDWDNVGLLAGRREKEVDTVYLAVDATDEVVADAIRCGAQMLLTHHPLIFKAMKKINTDDFIGRRLVKLLQADISYVAMHTNFDVRGMAQDAAQRMDLQNARVLEVTYEQDGVTEGIGRIGELRKKETLQRYAQYVKEVFSLSHVRIFGDPEQEIHTAAICPGSGKSVIATAITQEADVLVTGDIDHHEGIDAVAQGLAIIDAGHYGIEKIFVEYMAQYLKKELPTLNVITAPVKEPFLTI